jgi:hypothetical protein
MKCGGKVMKRGGLTKMQVGGTPPNCDPGYVAVGDKCVPTKIDFTPRTDFSLYNEKKDPFTLSGDKNNPFGLKNEGIFTKCPPNYKYDFQQGKCVQDPNSFITLNNAVTNTSFQILSPSGIETALSGCPPGQIKNIVTGECEPRSPSTTTTTTKPPGILPNVILEAANSAVNWASRMFAPDGQRRAQEAYLRNQLGTLAQRKPIPDWATNEQKQPIGYNLYTKYGGSINNNKNNNMINIKKENRGKFTAQAKRAGMGVQEFANYVMGNPDEFSEATMKRANFAKNAAGWKSEYGGMTAGNPYYSSLMQTNPLFMQEGGAMPMQGGMEGQEGGGDQMEQIIMMIVEALQEGMAPEEIIQALVQMGIPQEQAVQILQAVMEQLQGQAGGMGQGQPMQGGQQQAAPMMAYGGKSMPNNAGFRALPTNVQRMIMSNMQQGGMMGNNQQEEISMVIQAYARLTNQDPKKVMQQLLSMKSDDEKTAFLMEMQGAVSQDQSGASAGQMQQEQGMMRIGGMKSNYYR